MLLQPDSPAFEPVAEHKSWCPWVTDNVVCDRHLRAIASGHRGTVFREDCVGGCGWRTRLELLAPVVAPTADTVFRKVKTVRIQI